MVKTTQKEWPSVGRYIGLVDDEKPILFTTGEDFSCFDYYDIQPWQHRRVYGDEIELATNRINKAKISHNLRLGRYWLTDRVSQVLKDSQEKFIKSMGIL